MDLDALINGLIRYISLVVLLTFHEWGHAWMALKCGDDTARVMGRCSINPLVHIDPIGTVLIPMLQIFFPVVGTFLIGWAKPVPVNPHNLRNPRRDDILISMAGPAMNLILAVALTGFAKIGNLGGSPMLANYFLTTSALSLVLCFFNLIPIPPLDGSHVMRVLTGMSNETFYHLSRYGIFILIIVMQVTMIPDLLFKIVYSAQKIIGILLGMDIQIG